MDKIPLFPIWFSDLLFCDVFSHAVEHIPRVCRIKGSEYRCHPAMDVQTPVALGISRHPFLGRRSTVCVWLLQCDAHLHGAWLCHHAFVQAALMVRVLSDGNHDTAHLQGAQRFLTAQHIALSLQRQLTQARFGKDPDSLAGDLHDPLVCEVFQHS